MNTNMHTNIVEIVKWKAKIDVLDKVMIDAVNALLDDLQSIGGFLQKTLYKNDDEWVDIYYWETWQDAELSNQRMATKSSFQHLLSLVQLDTISITMMKSV